ncbi:MAG: hypothetical protein Kow0060_23320 [Methylohalobius crimeensis]
MRDAIFFFMTSVIQFYEQLSSAPDDKTRARLIAEAFERMEERYPEVKELATQSGLNETELRLQKEIETVRKEIVACMGSGLVFQHFMRDCKT